MTYYYALGAVKKTDMDTGYDDGSTLLNDGAGGQPSGGGGGVKTEPVIPITEPIVKDPITGGPKINDFYDVNIYNAQHALEDAKDKAAQAAKQAAQTYNPLDILNNLVQREIARAFQLGAEEKQRQLDKANADKLAAQKKLAAQVTADKLAADTARVKQNQAIYDKNVADAKLASEGEYRVVPAQYGTRVVPKDNTTLYIGLGIGAVALLGLVYSLSK